MFSGLFSEVQWTLGWLRWSAPLRVRHRNLQGSHRDTGHPLGTRQVRGGAFVSVIALSILILITQSRGGFLALVLMVLLVLHTQRRKLPALVAVAGLGGARRPAAVSRLTT
jgi:O-antigen ligase